jgi:hypothetical protein
MKNFAKCTVAVSFCLLVPNLSNAANEAFSSDSRWMTGDWDGVRSDWLDQGVDVELDYTGEMAANLRGGYDKDHTARWTEQYALGFKADLQKIFGWENSQFQFTVTERDGRNLTNDRIADPRVGGYSSSQEVYGRGQTWRLTQMWLSKGLAGRGAGPEIWPLRRRFGLQQLPVRLPEYAVLWRPGGELDWRHLVQLACQSMGPARTLPVRSRVVCTGRGLRAEPLISGNR